MTDTRIARAFITRAAAVLVAAMALACALVLPAYAKVLDAPTTVADDITRLQVNKLDADTHEPVVGATMVIVDENGNTVAEWVSDGSGFSIEKGLDVDVVYTLKELDPPDGYSAISPMWTRLRAMASSSTRVTNRSTICVLRSRAWRRVFTAC